MKTGTAGPSMEGREAARRGVARHKRRGGGWRLHTFSDGVCSITLTGPLDAETADRLQVRLRKLMERGCDRLVVDVTAAGEPGGEDAVRLAATLEAQTPSCELVVVLPRSSFANLLSAGVVLAESMSDARRLLGSPVGRWSANGRPGPGSEISACERHALAVRQALRWAERSAGVGDYESALAALATIERVEGSLPERWEDRRRAWLLAGQASVTQLDG